MSIVTRPKRVSESFITSTQIFDAEPAPGSRQEFEAPEQATCHREAPESRTASHAEAPDAGEGRSNDFDHEFTHGRSQS